jgi:hypothetical protein
MLSAEPLGKHSMRQEKVEPLVILERGSSRRTRNEGVHDQRKYVLSFQL